MTIVIPGEPARARAQAWFTQYLEEHGPTGDYIGALAAYAQVEAFDALLAVAQAAAVPFETENPCRLCGGFITRPSGHAPLCPIEELDAKFPNWREWTP